jgi:surfactin synthase thioesterase subunit
VYAGRGDNLELEALQGWQRISSRAHTLHFFEGDHFFVRTHTRELCGVITEHLLPAEHTRLQTAVAATLR